MLLQPVIQAVKRVQQVEEAVLGPGLAVCVVSSKESVDCRGDLRIGHCVIKECLISDVGRSRVEREAGRRSASRWFRDSVERPVVGRQEPVADPNGQNFRRGSPAPTMGRKWPRSWRIAGDLTSRVGRRGIAKPRARAPWNGLEHSLCGCVRGARRRDRTRTACGVRPVPRSSV